MNSPIPWWPATMVMPMKGITLFIFGGVAGMADEPTSPKVEFLMAIAGPITSIILALIFYGLASGFRQSPCIPPVYGVLQYLGAINGILAAFNLLPAFPLDGGRVLTIHSVGGQKGSPMGHPHLFPNRLWSLP